MSLSDDLKKRREELLGGTSSGGGLDTLEQRRQSLANGTLHKTAPTPTPVAPTPSNKPVVTAQEQNQNIFQKIGGAIGGVIKSLVAPKVDKPVSLSNGIKLNFVDSPVQNNPSTTLSIAGQAPTQFPAQQNQVKIPGPGITEEDIKKQKLARESLISPFKTGNENVWETLAPGTTQLLKNLGTDPLSLKKSPKQALTDVLKPLWMQPISQQASNDYIKGIKDALVSDGDAIKQFFEAKDASGRIGAAESVGARTVGAALSPITSLFNAANNIPVLGTVSKLISLPFATLGDAGNDLAYSVANALPISKQAKENIVSGTGEIIGLALMLGVGGKIADIPGQVKETLVKRYGITDAETIMTKAEEVAQNNEKPTLSGTKSPQEVIDFVQENQIGNTEVGKSLLKASSDALQTNKYLQIEEPQIAGLLEAKNPSNGKIAGEGFTMTDNASVDSVRVGRTLNEYNAAVDSYNKNPTVKSLTRVQNAREAVSSLEKEKMVEVATPKATEPVKTTTPTVVKGVEIKPVGEDVKVYRGTTAGETALNTEKANGITGGESTSTDKAIAQTFADKKGGTVQEYTIPKDATIVNHSDLERLTKYVPQADKAAVAQKFLKENNVDVVKFDIPNGAKGEAEYRVINKDIFSSQADKYLYHGTSQDILDNISKEGLKPMNRGLLSLSKDENYARSYAESSRFPRKEGQGVILRVKSDFLEGKTVASDNPNRPLSDQLHEVLTKENIPPEAIEIKVDGQWKSLPSVAEGEIGVPRDQLPTGGGKEKVSRLEARMKGVFGKATQDQIDEFGLSTFNQMNRKEVISDAAKWVTNHSVDEAIQILKGEKQAPKDIPPEAIYVALTQAAKEDLTLGTKLISLQATAMGQRLSLLAELDPFNPVKIANDIYKFKEQEFTKNNAGKSFSEAKKSMIEKGKSKIKAPKLENWGDFIKEVRC